MYIVDCKAGRSPAHEKKLKPINEGIKKMKKILAIMLIAVIAVAGVFATVTPAGPTSLNLTYGITAVFDPKFGIIYNGGSELAQGADVAVASATTSNGIVAGTSEVFKIVDHTKVNAAHSMVIGISLANGKWVGADNANYSGITIVDYSVLTDDNVTDRAVAAATTGEGVANSVTMTYGKAGVDRSANDGGKEIASFKVSWTADTTAPAQTYSSTLTITATAN